MANVASGIRWEADSRGRRSLERAGKSGLMSLSFLHPLGLGGRGNNPSFPFTLKDRQGEAWAEFVPRGPTAPLLG
jgi:hypothetical protein